MRVQTGRHSVHSTAPHADGSGVSGSGSMKRAAVASLLLLLQLFGCSTVSSKEIPDGAIRDEPRHGIPAAPPVSPAGKIAFDQPALWYGNAGGSGDTGPSPALSSDKWRLLLSEQGIHYLERSGSESSELLSIPFESIAAVRADPSERAYPTLVVDLIDRADGRPLSHVFLIMHPGSSDARSAATEVKLLIENRILRGPGSLAIALSPATEEKIQAEHQTSDVVREEKIAISAAQWQPAVEVREAARPESTVAERVKRYALNGAKGPGVFVAGCAQAGCPPGVFVPLLGLAAVGAAAGAVVALGTELVKSGIEAVSRPDAWSAEAAQAAVSTIRTAAGDSISQPALQQCVMRRLAPAGGEAASVRWSDAERAVSFSPLDGAGSISRDQTDAYSGVPRDGHRYVIETFLSRVLLVPEGRPGQDASDPLLRIVVEGGFRLFDLDGDHPREWTSEWRVEHRTLRAWSAADGAALNEALSIACNGLAERIVANAEEFWRNRR